MDFENGSRRRIKRYKLKSELGLVSINYSNWLGHQTSCRADRLEYGFASFILIIRSKSPVNQR